MKALHEYFLMVVFTWVLNTVHVLQFIYFWTEEHDSERAKEEVREVRSQKSSTMKTLSPIKHGAAVWPEHIKACDIVFYRNKRFFLNQVGIVL